MKKNIFFLCIFFIAPFLFADKVYCEDNIYYARCNLKVIKGNYITWVNWQSTPTLIPVGTKLRVSRSGSKATLVNVENGNSYTLDVGSADDIFLDKFVTKKPLNIKKFPTNVQNNITKTLAKIGMTKGQVYIAMGPPAWAGGKTHSMTYDAIMGTNLWVYKRKRFGKNIGVEFDPNTGKVNRTEGIWRK